MSLELLNWTCGISLVIAVMFIIFTECFVDSIPISDAIYAFCIVWIIVIAGVWCAGVVFL